MRKRNYVVPCTEVVCVEYEGDILNASSAAFGDEVGEIDYGTGVPPIGGFTPNGGGETEVVTDGGASGVRRRNVWDNNL